MRRAVYAGSFDPPTNGHAFMIQMGANLFDELIVAIGINPNKKTIFSIEERLTFLKEITRSLSNVKVDNFGNEFLINYANKIGAQYILRGIRNINDFHFEQTISQINRDQNPKINTVFLIPPKDLTDISSSFIKSLIGPKGWPNWIKDKVPDIVYQGLVSKFSDACI